MAKIIRECLVSGITEMNSDIPDAVLFRVKLSLYWIHTSDFIFRTLYLWDLYILYRSPNVINAI